MKIRGREVSGFALTLIGVLVLTILFSYAWSQKYPPVSADRQHIANQTDRISTATTSCIAFAGLLLGALATVGYLRRRKGVKAEERQRLRKLFRQAIYLLSAGILLGGFVLWKLSAEPLLNTRLPLSLTGLRTDFFFEFFFVFAGLIYSLRVIVEREK